MKKNNAVAFICVNYNSEDFTIKYIKSVMAIDNFENYNVKIVVVDNSEYVSDKLRLFVKNYKFVSIVRCQNDGYFSALNIGLNFIDFNVYDFICVGNNDLTFESGFLDILVSYKVEKEIFVISPDIINKDGVHQNPHHVNKLSFIKILTFDMYFSNYYIAVFLTYLKNLLKMNSVYKKNNHTLKINQGVGAFYILTRNFTSIFNSLYFPSFLYCEEAALSWQVHSFDGNILYLPTLEVYHHESASLSKLPKKTNYKHAQKSYKKIRKLLF